MRRPLCNIKVCDSVVRDLLPCMRAEVVYRLVHDRGICQSDVSKLLGISRAATSQYMNKKRGWKAIERSADMDVVIERWVAALATGDGAITICDLCRCAHK